MTDRELRNGETSRGRNGWESPPKAHGPGNRGRTREVVFRDLVIFQLKLALDGLKDVVLAPASLGAAALDLLFPGTTPGHRFYAVLRVGESFDRWLSLFGASTRPDARDDGLFGVSRAGAGTLLGRLEQLVVGHEEPLETPNPGG